MASVKLNPLIKSAKGRFGDIVFYNRYGRTYIRRYVIPRNPNTLKQRSIRRSFADAVKAWQNVNNTIKDRFNRKADYLNMSGYNLFISEYMKSRINSLGVSLLKHAQVNINPSSLQLRSLFYSDSISPLYSFSFR